MKAAPPLHSFNAGELSPLVEGRTDIAKYGTGCSILENFIPTVQGPLKRRSGTRYITGVKSASSGRAWLMPFTFNVTQSYIIEWGDYYARFYTNHGAVLGQPTQPTWGFINATTADGGGTLVWTGRGKNRWAASTSYSTHGVILDPNGNIQMVTNGGGTSGTLQPDFSASTVAGSNTTADNNVVWTCQGVPQWTPSTSYTLNQVVWTYRNIQQVTTAGTSGTGSLVIPYEIPTPWAITDLIDANGLFTLNFEQSNDVIYICHTSQLFKTYKLQRLAGANWQIVPLAPTGGPFKTVNPDETISVFSSAETGTGITLTASSSIWNSNHIGELFYLEQENIRNIDPWENGKVCSKGVRRRYNGITYECIDVGSGTTGSVPPTHTQGAQWDGRHAGAGVLWEYRDPGYGNAKIKSLGAAPAGTAKTITGITAAHPPVVTAVAHGFSNGNLVYITGVVGMEDVDNNFYLVNNVLTDSFELQDSTSTNIDGSTWDAYVSGGTADHRTWTATADVVSRIPQSCVNSDNDSSKWAHGAWSNDALFPSVVKFFRGRLTFGNDGNIWTSVADDFENFNAKDPSGQVTADMGISIFIPTHDPLQWFVEGDGLLVGTAGSEYVCGEINSNNPLGPSNITIKPQLTHGSRKIPAIRIGGEAFFVQTSGRKLRGMQFNFAQNSYVSSDMTVLAEHITLGGIGQMAYQQEPDSVIWFWRKDGTLFGFTVNREQDVMGWHRHPLGGSGIVESIAVIPSPDGSRDELWMIVQRTINSTLVRFVEYMEAPFELGDDPTGQFFVDAGLTYNSTATTTISGLSYLAGQVVDVLADGAAHPRVTVSGGGNITLNRSSSIVQVGLPIPARMVTERIEAGAGDYGTAQAKTKRITNVTFRLFNTAGGYYGAYGQTLDPIDYRQVTDLLNEPVPLFSGDVFLPWPDGYGTDAKIEYFNDQPFAVTLIAIYPRLETQDAR